MKLNLPVMLLREAIFLPYAELKLEFSSESSKNIVDEAEFFHDNHLLVTTQNNPLLENPGMEDICKIGVVTKIKQKMELPDGKTRITLEGVKRATIYEFLNMKETDGTLESLVVCEKEAHANVQQEQVLLSKLVKEIEDYVKRVSYVSDALVSIITPIRDLSKMTDVIAANLSFSSDKLRKYLMEYNPVKRAEMLLRDIYEQKEAYKIEEAVTDKVKEDMNQHQKEYLIREKIKQLKDELGEYDLKEEEKQNLLNRIKQVTLPQHIQEKLQKELQRYDSIPLISPETGIVHNYIDTVLNIPFGRYTEDNKNLKDVEKKLNDSHYALQKVKERVLEFLVARKRSPKLKSPILCLVGPSGVGKTSLAFSIARSLNRSFVKMSVGGVNDEAEIIGHRRTYLGSSPGKIISLLIKAKSMNPVFLIDEIDKMLQNEKGDPVSTLLDILDPMQNEKFVDHYIEEEIDLSSVLFITTANDISSIPRPLRDRLEIIEVSGYAEYEKLDIAFKYLIPEICEEYNIDTNKIVFDKQAITFLVRGYTKESGVRELKRKLSDIVRKIIKDIVLYQEINEKYCIGKKEVEFYLGPSIYPLRKTSKRKQIGVVNGLAYTYHGGEMLPIESYLFKGSGKLLLTGNLGDITKESAFIALSYIKANASYFGITYEKFLENDIHIHIPQGEICKNGPSAGIAIVTSLLSTLLSKKISGTLAMTGEMTLTGLVLAVGNIKAKILGAYRNQMEKVIVPIENQKEVDELPDKIKESMQIYYIKNYKECYKIWKEEHKESEK